MLVNDFKIECVKYENFQVWDVENMEAFFNGNQIIPQIFKDTFKVTTDSFLKDKTQLPSSDLEIVERVLDQIGDKHFYIFTTGDKNHLELIGMQMSKIMDFGIDISKINETHLYVVIMDKKKAYAMA